MHISRNWEPGTKKKLIKEKTKTKSRNKNEKKKEKNREVKFF